jgi:N-acyl-L-homoserine lactone synthetase
MENQEIIKPPLIDVTASVESQLFGDYQNAAYWIGRVALPGCVTHPDEYLAQRQLRANVYIDECNFLPPGARQADGGESDEFDDFATQYVVLENHDKGVRAVGALRMIHKQYGDLPAEELFASELQQKLPKQSLEASRFIARHDEKVSQALISIGLVRVAILQAQQEQGDIYAVVEEPLARRFSQIGLEYDELCPSKPIAEYNNTNNMLLRFRPNKVMETVKQDYRYDRMITPYLDIVRHNSGLGYYDKTMRSITKRG